MNQFLNAKDAGNIEELVFEALAMKENPYKDKEIGRGLKLGMLFMNPSLRTRLSTEMAAKNLGMDVQVLNMASEAWGLEFEEHAVMKGNKPEHIKEAAGVLGAYFDILALRSFPSLIDQVADENEVVFHAFARYMAKPILSMESATRHPLQSLADMMTIAEHSSKKRPKVVLTWAPHIKALPQAVPASFAEWSIAAGHNLHICHPPSLDLDPEVTAGALISSNQAETLRDADFIYVKNWSMRSPYGKAYEGGEEWMLTEQKLHQAPHAKIMHCLPVRRNVELSDDLLDSPRSLVLEQAGNRLWSAQVVLKKMIESIKEEKMNHVGN